VTESYETLRDAAADAYLDHLIAIGLAERI